MAEHDFLQRRLAGTLTEAVDGGIQMRGAGLRSGQRIGLGHAEIVMGMHFDFLYATLSKDALFLLSADLDDRLSSSQ